MTYAARHESGQAGTDRQIVLVSGLSRSGTTMLQRLLCGDPNSPAYPECGPISLIASTYLRQLTASAEVLGSYFETVDRLKEIYRKQAGDVLNTLLRNSPPQIQTVILKHPGALAEIRGYLELFERLKIIVIIRSPTEIIESRKAVAKRRSAMPWDDSAEAERLKDAWKVLERALEALRHCNGRAWVTTYSAAVNDPEKWMSMLTDSLEVEFSPELAPNPPHAARIFQTPKSSLATIVSPSRTSAKPNSLCPHQIRTPLAQLEAEYSQLLRLPPVFSPEEALLALRNRRRGD